MQNVDDALHALKVKLHGYPWFSNQVARCPLTSNAVIAYVNHMNSEVLQTVPDTVEGWNVKLHFVSSLFEEKKPEVVKPNLYLVPAPVAVAELLAEEPVFTPALNLRNVLFDLRRECGVDNLIDIFYETHDGDNAVSTLSLEYPTVREKMQSLYNEYGFDVLFEELDG